MFPGLLWLPMLFAAGQAAAPPPVSSSLRVVVLEKEDLDPASWRAIAALGANVVAALQPPSIAVDKLAASVGLNYIALLTTDPIEVLARDPGGIAAIRSQQNLAGFAYWDENVDEGFTTPETQQRAYATLKELFPGKLVLIPVRLAPIAFSPDFLDKYFRPAFTDLVTPYFYPVGTTILGEAREEDPWSERLAALLAAVAARVPEGKGVLPVLQGYEQPGYPVGARFPAAQLMVYRRFWPDVSNAALEAWEFPDPAPIVGFAALPQLQAGACSMFAGLAGHPARCRMRSPLPWR